VVQLNEALGPAQLQDAIVWYVVFVVSVSAHEGAHALVAYLGGDLSAYNAGQVSLNPVPHMKREPFGMVLLPVISALTMGWPLGWASTPYDPNWERRHPRRAAWMAAAGPAANFLLALLALAALRIGLGAGAFHPPEHVDFARMVFATGPFLDNLGRFLSMALVLNSILFLFNLIPFPPLDGATILTLFLSEDAGLRLKQVLLSPGVGFAGLLLAWYFFGEVVGPMWRGLLVLVHPDIGYGPA
jgi:Zn-dependent protease